MKPVAFGLFLIAITACGARADDAATLKFERSGKLVNNIPLDVLTKHVRPITQHFFDPRYRKEKTYHCLPIKDVMAFAYGKDWLRGKESEAVLTALDGYASVSSAAKLGEDGGCLAFEDAEFPNWEPVGRRKVNPGPFYLSWVNPQQSTENDYPWPYQLASINLVRFEERYPEVVPAGAPPNSAAYRGYAIFRARCLRCHSINQQGGRIGPDLNAPRNITTYRDKATLLAFIRQPSKFRFTEMPDHTDLSQQNIEDIYAYLQFKSKQPMKMKF